MTGKKVKNKIINKNTPKYKKNALFVNHSNL